VVIAIIGILIALLLPAVQAAREAARRMQCTNNLKQYGLSLHNYHDSNDSLPAFKWGIANAPSATNPYGNEQRASVNIALLPYMEQSGLYDEMAAQRFHRVCDPTRFEITGTNNYVTVVSGSNGGPFTKQVKTMVCPSDSSWKTRNELTDIGHANYVFCLGDTFTMGRGSGLFHADPRLYTPMAAAVDGTSNTIAMSERLIAPSSTGTLIKSGIYALNIDDINTKGPQACKDLKGSGGTYPTGTTFGNYTGRRAWDGQSTWNSFLTVLAPNSPNCRTAGNTDNGVTLICASSQHTGGANYLCLDGSVAFASDTVNTGDLSKLLPTAPGSRTNYGTWGAMGTVAGTESDRL
jgi:prepilin-type processing-associated H-X9-DG protein